MALIEHDGLDDEQLDRLCDALASGQPFGEFVVAELSFEDLVGSDDFEGVTTLPTFSDEARATSSA